MDKVLEWLKNSAIIRQQVVLIVVTLLTMMGTTLDFDLGEQVEKIAEAVAALVVLLIPIWTVITRIRKPAPNLSEAARITETRLVEEGKIPIEKASTEAVSEAKTSVSESASIGGGA